MQEFYHKRYIFLAKYLHVSKKSSTFAHRNEKKEHKLTEYAMHNIQ